MARPRSPSGHSGEEKNLLPLSNVICGALQVFAVRRNSLHQLMTPLDPRQLQSVERLREQFYFKVVHSVYFLYVSVHRLLTASQRIISCVGYGLRTIDRHQPFTTPQLANCMLQNQKVLFVVSNSRTSTCHGRPLREDKLLKGAGCNTVSFSRDRVKVSQHKEIRQYF